MSSRPFCQNRRVAIGGTELRFRAVMMNALSSRLGVIPLMFANGAASESRKENGTGVFGGMISATVLNLAVVTILYFVVQSVEERVGG